MLGLPPSEQQVSRDVDSEDFFWVPEFLFPRPPCNESSRTSPIVIQIQTKLLPDASGLLLDGLSRIPWRKSRGMICQVSRSAQRLSTASSGHAKVFFVTCFQIWPWWLGMRREKESHRRTWSSLSFCVALTWWVLRNKRKSKFSRSLARPEFWGELQKEWGYFFSHQTTTSAKERCARPVFDLHFSQVQKNFSDEDFFGEKCDPCSLRRTNVDKKKLSLDSKVFSSVFLAHLFPIMPCLGCSTALGQGLLVLQESSCCWGFLNLI